MEGNRIWRNQKKRPERTTSWIATKIGCERIQSLNSVTRRATADSRAARLGEFVSLVFGRASGQ